MNRIATPIVTQYQETVEPLQPPVVPVPDLSWQPVYQATTSRKVLPPSVIASGTTEPTRAPALPVPELAWSPTYPSRLERPWLPVQEQQAVAYVPALRTWGLDSGKTPWKPIYPDFPGRTTQRLPTSSQQAVAYNPAIKSWGIDGGRLGWWSHTATQPQPRTAPPPEPAALFFVEPIVTIAVIPAVSSWMPLAQIPPRLPLVLQESRPVEPVAPPSPPPITSIDWLPTFPATLTRSVPLQPDALTFVLDPALIPPPPAPGRRSVVRYGAKHYWCTPNPPYVE